MKPSKAEHATGRITQPLFNQDVTGGDGGSRMRHRGPAVLAAAEFRQWLDAGAGTGPADSVATADAVRAQPGADRKRRGGKSYDDGNAPLLADMARQLEAGEADSPWAAAQAVASRAKGGGTPDAKAKRLLGKFQGIQKRLGLNGTK